MDHTQNLSVSTSCKTAAATTWLYSYNVRYSIFLITCMCVGLPLAGWALRVLRQHRENGGKASAFITALLLTDLLEMVLSPPMLAYLFSPVVERSWVAFVLFYSVKYCGAHLHQMVALEGAMARTGYLPPGYRKSWHIFSVFFCLIEGIFLLLCLYVYPLFSSPAFTLTWLVLAIIPLAVTCKLTVAPRVSPLSHNAGQRSSYPVLAIAAGSFFTLYGPFLAFVLAQALPPEGSVEKCQNGMLAAMTIIHPLVCLRLLADPLLCVQVVREFLLDEGPVETSSA
ncbi:hypothetical protein ACEWY4_024886 [Coilia grayii]|uniref:G-protein coupled receptors family 1 profile domain-containing protein n=1 Tax=Coilia grayii TaxID=363190 RepID=A0ABD1IW03_9TELE